MTTAPVYLTTTIPYVNGRPHLGHALEFVQADVLARHYRRHGHQVRFQTGTDDNSLKNVLAAHAAGIGVQEFVDANAGAFVSLAGPLSLSVDDVIRTSTDPRHRAGVERLWQACASAGDLYRGHYEGLYCIGCEAFYAEAELSAGLCPEHGVRPHRVAEENWFFRLSSYAGRLRDEIASGRLRIEPPGRRNEVLAFIDGGLADFSVSRSNERAHGWGIPVPGDPGQVIYVWWDALGNYLTALGYGTDEANLNRWWTGAGRRVHLLGKGILRFHAVYWPAMLLSAGLPLPTDILVHDYLTVEGRRISKSSGVSVDPAALAHEYGTDARTALSPWSGNTATRCCRRAANPRGSSWDWQASARGRKSRRPLASAISAAHRKRSGRSPRKPTATSARPGRGLWPNPSGLVIGRPASSSTRFSQLWSRPAGSWPPS